MLESRNRSNAIVPKEGTLEDLIEGVVMQVFVVLVNNGEYCTSGLGQEDMTPIRGSLAAFWCWKEGEWRGLTNERRRGIGPKPRESEP